MVSASKPSTIGAVGCCWLAKCIDYQALYTRGIIIALALIAFGIATDLALYQTRVVPHVWDPVFDGQSERVLDSSVSRAIRRFTVIPDSALGAFAYLTEIALCLSLAPRSGERVAGGRVRGILFALNSLALVVAGIALVALQAFVVHAWCLLCLTSASISVVIAILAATELRSAAVRQR